MITPAEIAPMVEQVLHQSPMALSAYEILERLPQEVRDQVIVERGMPGRGNGRAYTAASLVTDAVERLPGFEREYVDVSDRVFQVAGEVVQPGNEAIGFYRLP